MAKDSTPVHPPKGDGCLLTKVNALWNVLFTGREELSALTLSPSVASGMSSVLDRAFKGEL